MSITKLIIYTILWVFSGVLYSQPTSKLVWADIVTSYGARSAMFNPLPVSGLIDNYKNTVFAIPVHDSLFIGQKKFYKKNNVNFVISKFDSLGKLVWNIPVSGKYSKVGIYASCVTDDNQFVFGAGAEDSVRIGNILYKDSGHLRYLFRIDSAGIVTGFYKNVFISKLRPSKDGSVLALADISHPNTGFSGGLKFTGAGKYLIRLEREFKIAQSIKLSASLSSNIADFCMEDDNKYFVAAVSDKLNELIFLDSTYKLSYTQTTPFKVSDFHLFCIDSNATIRWHLRLDSAQDGGFQNLRYLASMKNNRLAFVAYYSRSVDILGEPVFVKFRGGMYPYILLLNSNDGKILKRCYSDSVDGGETDHTNVFADLNGYSRVFITTLSKTGYHKWKVLPDSVKNFYGRMMMVADTGMNFKSFCTPVEVPRNNDFHPFVYSQMTALKSTDSVLYYAGYPFRNQGGYDYFIGLCGPPSMQSYNGIVSAKGWDIKIFPNPGSGILNITGEIPGSTTCYVMDPTGRICHSVKISEKSAQINIQELKSGLYFLVFVNPGRPNYTYCYIKQQ